MAGNSQALQNILGNRDAIRKIMQRDMNGQMDKIVESARANGTLVGGENGATFNPSMQQSKPSQPQQIVVNEDVIRRHSRMPRQILESFKDNPIQDGPLPPELGGSVLDGLNIPEINKPVVTESVQQAPVSQQGIDYSLIKTIVNEAVEASVKKYVSAMYKKLMTEQKNNCIKAIKIGENFSFIDEAQNVYTCKPQFKSNINLKD